MTAPALYIIAYGATPKRLPQMPAYHTARKLDAEGERFEHGAYGDPFVQTLLGPKRKTRNKSKPGMDGEIAADARRAKLAPMVRRVEGVRPFPARPGERRSRGRYRG